MKGPATMKHTRVAAILLAVAGGLASVHAVSAAQDVVTPPSYAYLPNFFDYYPPASRGAGEQGVVKVRICYDVKGKVEKAEVAESSGHARLDEAAVRASREIVVKPKTINRVPVADCAIIPARFSLKGLEDNATALREATAAREASKRPKTRETAELTYMPDVQSFYPRESKKAGEEGTSVVVVCYDKKGKVTSSELHSSSGFARLDEAAVRAGNKIRLDPAITDGVPQAGCGVVPFKFSRQR